ncbi:MAG: NAD-dependent epimerase/dehydratase family protein [Planctomycetota bacterium]
MAVAIVTGSAGLIGAESVRMFSQRGWEVVGIDNDMRSVFFGAEASTRWSRQSLQAAVRGYRHHDVDIRDQQAIHAIFSQYGSDIGAVVHAAAQPSHDWAARQPMVDFTVNALGTMNLLEATRAHSPQACFLFMSTNKVYGDNPNHLPLVEREWRWELDPSHQFSEHGIDESMSVDHTKHSLFGVSKLAADVMVQEYGRYFGMNTVCFRGGCLTGPGHSGTSLHGFLSYLVKCAVTNTEYTILGYQGKQVRDNIHSQDLVEMFWHYCQDPEPGAVYNAGGGRHSNCSIREAVAECERLTGRPMQVKYEEQARSGDHIWYISDTRRFQQRYPGWHYRYNLRQIMTEIHDSLTWRYRRQAG